MPVGGGGGGGGRGGPFLSHKVSKTFLKSFDQQEEKEERPVSEVT